MRSPGFQVCYCRSELKKCVSVLGLDRLKKATNDHERCGELLALRAGGRRSVFECLIKPAGKLDECSRHVDGVCHDHRQHRHQVWQRGASTSAVMRCDGPSTGPAPLR
jgi:hypothetical protein